MGAAEHQAEFKVSTFLFAAQANCDVQKLWSADVPGFIAKADRNWPAVTGQSKLYE